MSSTRWNGRRTVAALILGTALVLALIIVGVAMMTGNPSSRSRALAHQLVDSATVSALHEGSVHVAILVTEGPKRQVLSDDSGTDLGHQVIQSGKEAAQVIVSGTTAYVLGNGEALATYFNFPSPLIQYLVDRWVSFRPSDLGYRNVTIGVTLPSTLKALVPAGALSASRPIQKYGEDVIGISGTGAKEHNTLYVQAKGRHLPIAATQIAGRGTNSTRAVVLLSDWGEKLHITPPASSIDISAFTAKHPESASQQG